MDGGVITALLRARERIMPLENQHADAVLDAVDVNAVNSFGDAAIHLAVRVPNPTALTALLAANDDSIPVAGAVDAFGTPLLTMPRAEHALNPLDVNVPNGRGDTALMLAAYHGHSRVIKQLLDAGANVNACNVKQAHGGTALMYACWMGHVSACRLLLASTDIDVHQRDNTPQAWPALLYAAGAANGTDTDRPDVIRALLNAGADVTVVDGHDGRNALMQAAGNGYVEATQLLLSLEEVDVNLADRDGVTAIMMAAIHGRAELVRLLLNNGKPPNAVPAERAERAERSATIEELEPLADRQLLASADVTREERPTTSGRSKGKLAKTSRVVDVNAVDKEGYSALIWAAGKGHAEAVSALLSSARDEAGASTLNVNVTTRVNRDTALMMAAANDHVDVIALLLRVDGIDVNARNDKGDSALLLAARYGFTGAMKTLLSCKAVDKDATDRDEFTAGTLARKALISAHAQRLGSAARIERGMYQLGDAWSEEDVYDAMHDVMTEDPRGLELFLQGHRLRTGGSQMQWLSASDGDGIEDELQTARDAWAVDDGNGL